MKRTLGRLRELRRYPTAIFGLAIIGGLLMMSAYAVIFLPFDEALRLWRGGAGVWDENPRNAPPAWTALFSGKSVPRTIVAHTGDASVTKTVVPGDDGRSQIEIVIPFDYPYEGFPSEVALFTTARLVTSTRVTYSVFWRNPLGQTLQVSPRAGRINRGGSDTFFISQSGPLLTELGVVPEVGLFTDWTVRIPQRERVPLNGAYALVVRTEVREGEDFDARLVVYGQVHGLAGTDHRRRDLTVALLWGAPFALIFGLAAAVGSTLTTFVLAGIGTWYGRAVDFIFQRITNVNMLIPLIPILIMVGHFYSRSLWLMLGLVIALSIFSAAMITYRAMFLQAKEAPYIEAAQAYGARNMRIVFRYLLPRIVPVLLPTFVLVVPSFVFLEASLAVIGLGDPILPTWGKIIDDAQSQGALYKGYYYWVLAPAVLLMATGFGFAMVGYALDRVFNPRLRTV